MKEIKEHKIKPKNRWGRGYSLRGGEFDKEAYDKMRNILNKKDREDLK